MPVTDLVSGDCVLPGERSGRGIVGLGIVVLHGQLLL